MQKKFLSILLSIIMMLGYSTQVLAASEPVIDVMENMGTFEEVEEGIFEFRNANGTLLATFREDDSIIIPRSSWTLEWTIPAKKSAYSSNKLNVSAGDVISVNISFSRSGQTTIGLYDRTASSYVWAETKTSGFKGTITIDSGSSVVSLALGNGSDNEITYTGSYSFN